MIQGKDIMIWNVPAIYDGIPEHIVELLKITGFQSVSIKAANGSYIQYPGNWPNFGENVQDNLIMALRAADIKVYLWHFLYGSDPQGELNVAINQASRFQPDGWIWDVETSFDNKSNAVANANLIASGFKKAHPGISQGLCWWALPKSPTTGTEWHPIKVANEFFKFVDVGMPMMYWQGQGAMKAVEYFYKSIVLWREMTDLPVMPIGRAYNGDGGICDAPGITAFSDEVFSVKDLENLCGNSWYSLDKSIQQLSWMGALQDSVKWEISIPPIPPDPNPVPCECLYDETIRSLVARVGILEDSVIELEDRVDALEDGRVPSEPDPEGVEAIVKFPVEWTKEWTVAWAISGYNDDRIPIISTNAYHETGDPDLKFVENQVIRVDPKAVVSDGGLRWFELLDVPLHGYGNLFIKKEHAMKLE